MERDRVLKAVEIVVKSVADSSSERSALQAAGFSEAEARVITDTLPEAFALPAMEELGLVVGEVASVRNSVGEWVKVSLSECLFFQSALALAREHRARGVLVQDIYRAIAERSAMVDAVNKALNAGDDVRGATFSIALIGAKAEDFDARS